MQTMSPGRVLVAENVLLDGRLALFHEEERWLAVADLHFGYELSHRAAGNLFPLWGMKSIETRLSELLGEYHPAKLVLLGDLVHDKAAIFEFCALAERLREYCEVILIAGNHDRHFRKCDIDPSTSLRTGLLESWRSNGFFFHHGHCQDAPVDCIQIVGHHHPAAIVRDGAGLCLKLPAFVQQESCWIMPAFSPWAAGAEWEAQPDDRVWMCSPGRVVKWHGQPVRESI